MTSTHTLLFTGKGGVGTTTIAGATAVRLADRAALDGGGARILLLTVGPAHTLPELLDRQIVEGVAPISENLWVEQVAPSEMGPRAGDPPGAGPAVIDAIVARVDAGDWATIVVDAAPVGMPAGDQVSVRLVITPERSALAAARHAATSLALHGHGIDVVVANRVAPPLLGEAWFAQARHGQAGPLARATTEFAPACVLRAPLEPTEIAGIEALRALAGAIYGADDPARYGPVERPLRIVRVDGGYDLTVVLPFATREAIDLGRQGDELHLVVGSHRRVLVLPDSVRRRQVGAAEFLDGRLVVHFVDPA